MGAATLTRDQKELARKAARARKEKARRDEIREARKVADTAGVSPDVTLDAVQRRRAIARPTGLEGAALRRFILDGVEGPTPVETKVERARRERRALGGRRRRPRKDPEAAALAAEANALREAKTLKGGQIRAAEARGMMGILRNKDPLREAAVPEKELRRYAAGEELPDVRTRMIGLSKLTGVGRASGRRAALLILALAERRGR